MKKAFCIIVWFGLAGVILLAGCRKQEAPPTPPATNAAPAAPSTNAPAATNAPTP